MPDLTHENPGPENPAPAGEHALEHADVHIETTDASAGWIFCILVGAAAFLAIIFVVVWVFFSEYRAHLAAVDRSPYPLAPTPSTALPPEPRLEQVDRLSGKSESMAQRESARLRVLDSYGPAGEGYVHVPIERAMQVIVEKKLLKSRPESPVDPRSTGLVDAGEPNSGRLFKGGAK